jgi:hypothetical protein
MADRIDEARTIGLDGRRDLGLRLRRLLQLHRRLLTLRDADEQQDGRRAARARAPDDHRTSS